MTAANSTNKGPVNVNTLSKLDTFLNVDRFTVFFRNERQIGLDANKTVVESTETKVRYGVHLDRGVRIIIKNPSDAIYGRG